ncbi:Ribosomal-protein-S18p-alanine acetyltransferase [Trichlorobacter ammonificans]|uniref:Ribosomal-protein-S18p-alanine acetyltransferase n=2 Tax=Trichlorobacter ammonificans TaxID=2916410 RepID=A0ABM9DC33_9BACT|nr:Ribosomal-protein-S18p-alanine acetyltransferase [Trichlorobacter ammonificans]
MIAIRPMTEADLDAVLTIERDCFPRPWNRDHFLAELASPRAAAVVAVTEAGAIAGYLCLSVLLDEAEILDVAVLPTMQRSGIGALLLSWACREAAVRGAAVLRLEVRATSLPARALYERFGFVGAGLRKGYYEQGIDAVVMEKTLSEEDGAACSSRQ